jgi:hypothetical protein
MEFHPLWFYTLSFACIPHHPHASDMLDRHELTIAVIFAEERNVYCYCLRNSLRPRTPFSIFIRNIIFSLTSCTFRIRYHTSNTLWHHNCWFHIVGKRLPLKCWLAFVIGRKIINHPVAQLYSFYTWCNLIVNETYASLIFLLLFAIKLTYRDS